MIGTRLKIKKPNRSKPKKTKLIISSVSKKYPQETLSVIIKQKKTWSVLPFLWFDHKGVDTSLTEILSPWHQS